MRKLKINRQPHLPREKKLYRELYKFTPEREEWKCHGRFYLQMKVHITWSRQGNYYATVKYCFTKALILRNCLTNIGSNILRLVFLVLCTSYWSNKRVVVLRILCIRVSVCAYVYRVCVCGCSREKKILVDE